MSELAVIEEKAIADGNEEQLVTMTVDGQLFGLSILSVQDIVETHNITQVPRTPSAISGIMNLRGRIVTVLNLRRILGRNDESSSKMGVTVEANGDLYTILVDEIGEVRLLDRSDFETAPATLDPKLKQLCTGIYRLDGELLAVLDVSQILSGEIIAQTPPIKFVARRPAVVEKAASPTALPAPANDSAEDEADSQEKAAPEDTDGEAASATKAGKNIFRKQKSSPAVAAPKEEAEIPAGTEASGESVAAAADAAPIPAPKVETASSETQAAISLAPESPVEDMPVEDEAAAQPHANATDVTPGKPAQPKSENLLDELGGDAALTDSVKGFFELVAGDSVLAPHYEGVDLDGQAAAMVASFGAALKGPENGGSGPSTDHKWLSPNKGLDDDAFNACLNHFEQALQKRSVPDGTIFRVLALFERHRESIVD